MCSFWFIRLFNVFIFVVVVFFLFLFTLLVRYRWADSCNSRHKCGHGLHTIFRRVIIYNENRTLGGESWPQLNSKMAHFIGSWKKNRKFFHRRQSRMWICARNARAHIEIETNEYEPVALNTNYNSRCDSKMKSTTRKKTIFFSS